MVTLVFPKTPTNHHYIPLRLYYDAEHYTASALYDTGATYCSVPKSINDEIMHLSVLGQNSDIETARGLATFDYSTLEKVEILEYLPLDEPFEGKAITVKNVKIWICPENDVFTAGANLFLDLQVIKDKQGQLQIND